MGTYFWSPMYNDLSVAIRVANKRAEKHRGIRFAVFRRACRVGERFYVTVPVNRICEPDDSIIFVVKIDRAKGTFYHTGTR